MPSGKDEVWRTIPAWHLKRVDIIPHAVFDEENQVAAIGFHVHFVRRKHVQGRPRISLPTASYDTVVPCKSPESAFYQATTLALRGFKELRPGLQPKTAHILLANQGINWVVKHKEKPARSAHVRKDLRQERKELLAALKPYGKTFRRHGYKGSGWPASTKAAPRRTSIMELEERLLSGQLNRKRKPKPALMVSLDDIGKLLESVQGGKQKVPPLLPAIVGYLHARGVPHRRIADALAQNPRAIRNALARWKEAQKGARERRPWGGRAYRIRADLVMKDPPASFRPLAYQPRTRGESNPKRKAWPPSKRTPPKPYISRAYRKKAS